MEIMTTKITIQIGKKKIKLTPEEARALRDELNHVVGDIHYIPQPIPYTEPLKPYRVGDAPFIPYVSSGTNTSIDDITITSSNTTDKTEWFSIATKEIANQVSQSMGSLL